VPAGGLGEAVPDLREQVRDDPQEPLAVRDDPLVDGVRGVGVLDRGVEEGAPAEAGGLDIRGDVGGDGAHGVLRGRVARPGLLQAGPEVAVGLLQVGEHQVLLAGEVAVERGAGRAGLVQDPVDRHRVQPLGVEDPARGAEQPRPRFGRPVACGACHGRKSTRENVLS
jgi:hypothetical protein